METVSLTVETVSLTVYKEGRIFEFVTSEGRPYQIIIEAIGEDTITLRNLRRGCRPMTLPTKAALEILESPERVR